MNESRKSKGECVKMEDGKKNKKKRRKRRKRS